MAEERERATGRGRPWLRAWLVIGLAAWAQIGVVLVGWAQAKGLVEDISFSPYHLVGYAALLVLAVYVAWAFFRGLRRGDWRRAFPDMYGGLGLAFVFLLAWVILDIVWRSTLGINPGIEEGLSPPRLLIPIALALLAAGPVREAIAARARPGLEAGELPLRWAGVVGAALVGGALLLLPLNPIRDPLNDLAVNRGVDATEIWTMAADGSAQTRLLVANGDGIDYSLPAWSPDGDRIAYTVWTNDGGITQNVRYQDQAAEIWTMAADGSDQRLAFDNALITSSRRSQAWIPAWSPDGQWIAFTVSHVGPLAGNAAQPQENVAPGAVGAPAHTTDAAVWIVHPDGTGSKQVTADGVNAIGLVWAPDHRRLLGGGFDVALVVDSGGGSSDIHLATLTDGVLSNERPLVADPGNDWGASWSPDGTKVAFTSERSGNAEVWVAAVDGSSLTQLTNDGAGDWVPVFSPDGSRIVFVSDRTGEPEIWSMSPDGGDLQDLTNHPLALDGQWSVAWSPDGARLAYATAAFQDASTSGWVREDLASAQAILFGLWLAFVALLIVALGAPLGSFTLAMLLMGVVGVFATEGWRFLPGLLVSGALTDLLVRTIRARYRSRAAAAAFPALANLAVGITIGMGGTLAWSLTLLFGVAAASGVLGWALAEVVERLLQRPVVPGDAPAR